MKTTAQTTRLLLATVAGCGALLAVGATGAAAAPAASQQATSQCWKDVVNDWLKHQPDLVGTYAIPCYTQAIQHLSAYPDLEGYSSATDDIHRALLAAIHQDRNNGPGSGPPASSSPGGSSGTPSSPSGGSDDSGTASGGSNDRGLFGRTASSIGPSNAESIPLPLIVLGGLALLLLVAAAGTWLARRVQSRRMPPAAASQD